MPQLEKSSLISEDLAQPKTNKQNYKNMIIKLLEVIRGSNKGDNVCKELGYILIRKDIEGMKNVFFLRKKDRIVLS